MKKWLKRLLIAAAVMAGLAAAATAAVLIAMENTDIPKLYIEGYIGHMYEKSDERQIAVTYCYGDQEFSGYASLKVQGTSSLAYEKKNYTIKLYSDDAHKEKLKVDFGWGEENKYCLKANWIDRTHARNVVSAKLVHQMQSMYGILQDAPRSGAVDGFPVEVYDNGEFHGLYTLNIPKGDWQFAMDEDNPDHILVCGELNEGACEFKDDPSFEAWELESGQASEQTLQKLQEMTDFVRFSSDEEFVAQFEDHFNLDAALNYYVFADMAYLVDNRAKNMLLATYDGQHWYLSLYDLDSSWGAHYTGTKLFGYEETALNLKRNYLFERMEQLFAPELAQRYFELRESVLSDEHIMAEFEAFQDQIPHLTFAKEIFRWTVGAFRLRSELPGYEYDQIEQYLSIIGPRLDEKYSNMLN